MNNDVRLEKIALDDSNGLNQILDIIHSDEQLKDTFGGYENTILRIANASYVAHIKYLNKTVGFVMIVINDRTNTNEVDMGILEGYRKQGIGTKALGLLKEIIIKKNINVQVQIQNVNSAAIQTVLKNGFVLLEANELYSYYTVDLEQKQM